MNQLEKYKEDIRILNEMGRLYNKTTYLNSGFYNDMMNEIKEQIKHCKRCIVNIEEFKNENN